MFVLSAMNDHSQIDWLFDGVVIQPRRLPPYAVDIRDGHTVQEWVRRVRDPHIVHLAMLSDDEIEINLRRQGKARRHIVRRNVHTCRAKCHHGSLDAGGALVSMDNGH